MKATSYVKRNWGRVSEAMPSWQENWRTLADPFHLQSNYAYRTWIEQFDGPWPPQMLQWRRDIEDGVIVAILRDNADVAHLLGSARYRLARLVVSTWERMRGLDSYMIDYRLYSAIRRVIGPAVLGLRKCVSKVRQ